MTSRPTRLRVMAAGVICASVLAIAMSVWGDSVTNSGTDMLFGRGGSAVHGGSSSEDPVLTAVETFLSKNSNALICGADHERHSTTVGIDVVEDGRVVTYRVTSDGKISEYKRAPNADQVANARAATIPLIDALTTAKIEHPSSVHSVVLAADDGLHWEIDFDDEELPDLTTVRIAAR